MKKSYILIEEEVRKNDYGRATMNRIVTVKTAQEEKEIYKEEITPQQYAERESPLNDFYKWVLELYEKPLRDKCNERTFKISFSPD